MYGLLYIGFVRSHRKNEQGSSKRHLCTSNMIDPFQLMLLLCIWEASAIC